MRAATYARVSSHAQRDAHTIDSQLRMLPAFVAARGWTLVGAYVDDGHSAKAGKLEDRRGLAALLTAAAAGTIDVVVVVDVDRITRSEDLAERGAILGALQRAGVKIASTMSGQVLDLSTSTGDLFTTLHAFFAAEWTRKHRERVMQGRVTAVQRGRKPAGLKPWWLEYDKAAATWSIDLMRGPIVREMFDRVAAGESCRAIADDLHARGVPRPRGEWHRSRVQRIIRSRAALGEWTVDQGRGLVLAVPPVVEESLWQRAQVAIAKSGRRGLRRTRHDYLLEGLAICGQCGATMGIQSKVWDRRRNGRWSPANYLCKARRIFRRGGERCAAPVVRVEDADARAWASIIRELGDPGLGPAIAGALAEQSEERQDWEADAAGYRRRLDRLQDVEAKLLARFTRGAIGEGALDIELARIGRERAAVRAQLDVAARAGAASEVAGSRLRDAHAILGELRALSADAPFALRRALVERLVRPGGVVVDGQDLRITLWVPRPPAAMRHSHPDAKGNDSVREAFLRIRLVA